MDDHDRRARDERPTDSATDDLASVLERSRTLANPRRIRRR